MTRAHMSRADWNAHIESVPLTADQLGRIHAEYRRLGLDGDGQRPERLAITAALAGLDDLDSTMSLTQGQAGRVVRALMDCPDRSELPSVSLPAADSASPGPQAGGPPVSQAWQTVIYTLVKALMPGALPPPGAEPMNDAANLSQR